MIWILLDTKNGYPFISQKIGLEHQVIVSPHYESKLLTWIHGAWNAIKLSSKSDTLICVYDFQGVLCHWLSYLTFRKRKILAINILLKEKETMRNQLARFLYRHALKSNNFKATVSTEEYGERIARYLGIENHFHLLKDVFYESYLSSSQDSINDGGYIFCGGRNGRDWDFISKVAVQCKEYKFVFVMPHSERQKIGNLPENVECYVDISLEEFNRLLAHSSIVALPFDTQAPAGLIVMFQAGAYRKPVMVTATVSTRQYVANGQGIGLPRDVQKWRQEIIALMDNPTRRTHLGQNLHNYLVSHCNEDLYVSTIRSFL